MAILSHKWLILWRKKYFFIHLSWHGGYGPLLSLFEDLEVPKLHKSPIVWPGLPKTSAPLSTRWRYLHKLQKGTGYSERPGKVMMDLWASDTSRCSNELKSWPQPPCQLRLMKIYFLRHNISHLWLKIAIIWPFFSHFWPIFADFLLYRLHLWIL